MKAVTHAIRALWRLLKSEPASSHAPGFFGVLWRLCCLMLTLGRHRAVMDAAVRGGCPGPLLQAYFRVVYRPTMPYLSTVFTPQERLSLLQAHFAYINGDFGAALFARVLSQPLELWRQQADGHVLSIVLGGPCPHREGGLTLALLANGSPIYRIAFSVVKLADLHPGPGQMADPAARGIYVGQVQGVTGQYQAIREATRQCLDVAPPDMLFAALLGLAEASQIRTLAAVKFEHCLSFRRMQELKTHFDSAQFWEERRGAGQVGDHYWLPLPLAEKPLSEIKANHRKRTQLKRAFKHEVAESVRATLRPLMGLANRPAAVAGAGSKARAITRCASGPRVQSRWRQTMGL